MVKEMKARRILKVGAPSLVLAVSVAMSGCGNLFDYNAQEFKRLNDSGKRFENISDTEIDTIVKRLIEAKATIVSPISAAADLGALSSSIVPGALDTGTASLLDSSDSPCKGNSNVIECQPLQARFYFGETKKLVDKLTDELSKSFARAALLLDVKFDPKNPKPSSRAVVPSNIKPLLPAKWRDAELAYNAPCRYHFKMLLYGKRNDEDTTLNPLSYLIVQSDPNRKDGESDADYAARKADEAACVKDNNVSLMTFPSDMDSYTSKYFFSIDGKTGKVKDAVDGTVGNLYVGFKDAKNFYIQAQIASIPCQTSFTAVPKNAVVKVLVEDGVWKGKVMSYSQHLGDTRSTPCDRNDENFDAEIYMDTIANGTHFLTSSYSINPALADTEITRDQIAVATNALTTHCDSGRWSANQCSTDGKIGSETKALSAYGTHACILKGGASVDKWFSFSGYDSSSCGSLKTSDMMGSSYWVLPKYLKDSMSVFTVPKDSDI